MKKDAFSYIFRFCCDPGFNDETQVPALERFVREADIDDVAVFANVEELNTGHMSFEEQQTYIRLMKTVRDMLAPMGVSVSVNQWHSIMHADLGKHLRADQPFRLMVDPDGKESSLCVCPLDESWQRYIGQIYANYLEVSPSILWVEDDFRLHNHAPLAWGGCFCEEHMKLYSERAGRKLTREEFVRGILQPGKPHPYRKIFLDVSRQTMLSAASAIGQAVQRACAEKGLTAEERPSVGLMCSVPQTHEAEGRDWKALLSALSGGKTPVLRPHLPAYQEMAPSQYLNVFNRISMLTRAYAPAETRAYPELENFPYSRFVKSRRFTRFQLLSLMAMNPAGVMIDLYDLNGNGIVFEDHYQDMLHETKPFLNALKESGALEKERTGVKVLVSQKASYTVETTEGKSLKELEEDDTFFAAYLPAMGIPFTYTENADLSGQSVALSGQVLRVFGEETIRSLFRHNRVILNGDAAQVLLERGLGSLAGIASLTMRAQDSGAFTYEQVINGRRYENRDSARASAVFLSSDVADIRYEENALVQTYTAFFDSFRQRRMNGQTVVDGHIFILPFGHLNGGPFSLPCQLMNPVRAQVLQDALTGMESPREGAFPLVLDEPYLEPYAFGDDLYLVNGSMDDVPFITLQIPPSWQGKITAVHAMVSASPDAGVRKIPFREEDGRIRLDLAVRSMESVLVRFQGLSD